MEAAGGSCATRFFPFTPVIKCSAGGTCSDITDCCVVKIKLDHGKLNYLSMCLYPGDLCVKKIQDKISQDKPKAIARAV